MVTSENYFLNRIEMELQTRSTEELERILNKIKVYSINLFINNNTASSFTKVEYVKAKIEDELMMRKLRE